MSPSQYNRIVLNSRPVADIQPDTFRTEVMSYAELKPSANEVLVQVTWLSLDPAMRGYLRDVRSYMPPVQIGATMRAQGLGYVVEVGSGSGFKVGELVRGNWGWTEYAKMADKDVEHITLPNGADPLDFLNTLGTSGLTAYFGLKDTGALKAGETLLVSGAAGSVGSAACQIGKKMGAKVIAIAGSQEKCDWLVKDVGVDMALNYKSPTFKADFKKAGFIDVYFDNVGGEILDMVLGRLNKYARIAFCGAISAYNHSGEPYGLKNYMALISQRATIKGFLIFDYESQFPGATKEMASWLADGTMKRQFHIVEGLESAPTALPMLFSGGNTGKLVVHVSGAKSKF